MSSTGKNNIAKFLTDNTVLQCKSWHFRSIVGAAVFFPGSISLRWCQLSTTKYWSIQFNIPHFLNTSMHYIVSEILYASLHQHTMEGGIHALIKKSNSIFPLSLIYKITSHLIYMLSELQLITKKYKYKTLTTK